jgi:hypothetical protein
MARNHGVSQPSISPQDWCDNPSPTEPAQLIVRMSGARVAGCIMHCYMSHHLVLLMLQTTGIVEREGDVIVRVRGRCCGRTGSRVSGEAPAKLS